MSALFFSWILTAALSGACVWLLIAVIGPWLARLATVRPNARSSHTIPTPQGAGVAVVPVALLVAALTLGYSGSLPPALTVHAAGVAFGALALMVVGLLDDVRNLPIFPRLAVQAFAVGAVVMTLPVELRILPGRLPLEAERMAIFAAGLWFVNLYNFMDGIDLMCATETAALAFGIATLAALGFIPVSNGWVAAALGGSMLGFAVWNKPVARIFLGDSGSLAVSLLIGALLLQVAVSQALAAALILPLYYLMDATITVVRRLVRRQKIWEGHRDHYYQQARLRFSVIQIIGIVAGLNVILIGLAIMAALFAGPTMGVMTFALAVAVVAPVLRLFAAR